MQFANKRFTRQLNDDGMAIRMDGKGCWRDDVFVERWWKMIKYQGAYPTAAGSASHGCQSPAHHIDFYSSSRP